MPEDMTMLVEPHPLHDGDELAVDWVLVGRAVLTPSIPDSRLIQALVFRTPAGEHFAIYLDKGANLFRKWRVPAGNVAGVTPREA